MTQDINGQKSVNSLSSSPERHLAFEKVQLQSISRAPQDSSEIQNAKISAQQKLSKCKENYRPYLELCKKQLSSQQATLSHLPGKIVTNQVLIHKQMSKQNSFNAVTNTIPAKGNTLTEQGSQINPQIGTKQVSGCSQQLNLSQKSHINNIIQSLLKGINNHHHHNSSRQGSFKKRRLIEENNDTKEPLSAKFLHENQQSFNGSNGFKTPCSQIKQQEVGQNFLKPTSDTYSFKIVPSERTILNMQQIKASNQLNINCSKNFVRSPLPFQKSQKNSPVTDILRPKMQPTDSSENKNLAQGIKVNLCQRPSTSAFKLVSMASNTSQNQGNGYQKNLANDTFRNLIKPNLQVSKSKILEDVQQPAKVGESISPVDFKKHTSTVILQKKPLIKTADGRNDSNENGTKTPKSSISLLSRESRKKQQPLKSGDKKRGAINLELLQLALNNCESSIGPKKWHIDQNTTSDKFKNFHQVMENQKNYRTVLRKRNIQHTENDDDESYSPTQIRMRPFDLQDIQYGDGDSSYLGSPEKRNKGALGKRPANRKKEKAEKRASNRTSTRLGATGQHMLQNDSDKAILNTVCDIDSKYPAQNGVGQKRKRKTERELRILRQELRKNLMWTRESIKQMRIKYESEFFMTEQQIYKWWWDQTRKRSKKAVRKAKGSGLFKGNGDEEHTNCKDDGNSSSLNEEEGEMIVSFQDEFGGYCSRLRIDANKKRATCEKDVQDVPMQVEDGDGPNIDVNLCKLLNIDVDRIALRIAMGEDPWADEDNIMEEQQEIPVITQEKVVKSSKKVTTEGAQNPNTEYCLNKTDMKHSTVISMTRESHCRSQSDMKLQDCSNLKTVDGLLEVPSESDPKTDGVKPHHRHTQSQPILKNQSPSSEIDVINDKNQMILQDMMEPIEEFNINSLKLKKCKQQSRTRRPSVESNKLQKIGI